MDLVICKFSTNYAPTIELGDRWCRLQTPEPKIYRRKADVYGFYIAATRVQGQTGRVLYWESGFSFVFLICMAAYVSPYPRSDRPSSILGVGILFRLSNLYGCVRVPVCGHSSVCLCAIIYVSRPFTSVFFLIYYFRNSIFNVNTFYVSDF
jgi:hypothetical protein